MADYDQLDPIPNFRFHVEFSGFQAIFMECTISPLEWKLEEVVEGGRNDYTHWLPGRRTAGKATLKYGLTKDLDILKWYKATLEEDFDSYRQDISITLRMTDRTEVIRWDLEKAIPEKITWPSLKMSDNAVAIESLDLKYQALMVTDLT
jgi:phage tail-like protein